MHSVHLTRISNNVKTGPIPVSTSSQATCPPTCGFLNNGCYASNFPLSIHFKAVTDGRRGMPWEMFVDEISRLPKGQIWRHNQAGDLAGADGVIDAVALKQLVRANKGRRGFSYSHYPPTPHNLKALRHANKNGLTINMSADSLTEADTLVKHGIPLVVVVPEGWKETHTPQGNPVTLCPAQLTPLTCATCALCQKADRRAIVAFEAHGARKKTVERVINIKMEKP